MNKQYSDLFGLDDAPDKYPLAPGFKGEPGGPSHLAAKAIHQSANNLRGRVLSIFDGGRNLTADEIAAELGKSAFSIRPRVAELHAAGLIERAPGRATNQSGMTASLWRKAGPRP